MSNEVKKGKLFLKEVMGRLKGDDAEVKGAKITRKAISAFESQIAGLNASLVDAEDNLETKQEELQNTIYPTETFSDNKSYCASIVRAQEAVDAAQENVDNIKESLKFFKGLLAKID